MTPTGIGIGMVIGVLGCTLTTLFYLFAQIVKAHREKLRIRQTELDMLYRDFINQEDCEMLTPMEIATTRWCADTKKARSTWTSGSTEHAWHV